MEAISTFIHTYLSGIYFPDLKWTDVLDIIIIAYIIYHLLLWVKTSRAWTLVKGVVVVALFLIFAAIVKLNTILWIAKNLINVFLLAIVVLFQPELRRALDELGRKNIISRFFSSFASKNNDEKALNDKTIYELVKTSVQLAKDKTGALIVIEHDTPMGEYIDTGIKLESVVSQQLLINIFEKNTPLHDGAVIIQKNRVAAATCYLPLTDNKNIAKSLGTRHRAGLGISEVSDSMTIIVSEETGSISVAYKGQLYQDLDEDGLRRQLTKLDPPKEEKPAVTSILRKGGGNSEG
ncbi:MAG: diadenylate cyclase CdaA [Eubacterium sp.]|nr:diadenylate cyclase CdaA [Eubacterium sp.]